MRERLFHLWDTLRASYWTIPGFFCSAALLLSWSVPRLDRMLVESSYSVPHWMYLPAPTLRVFLPAIAGSLLSIAGTLFSVIIVVLSLTSSQFGPRLLRTFMKDLATQITLGMFIAAALYAILLLPYIGVSEQRPLLALSVATALVFLVCCLGMFIYFVHHIAVLIQAPQVVTVVAAEFREAIVRLTDEREEKVAPDPEFKAPDTKPRKVRVEQEGYVVSIDEGHVVHFAEKHDLLISFVVAQGDFVSGATFVAEVWGDVAEDVNLSSSLSEMIITASRRSPRQDLECTVSELVEIAVRALSPGINDPFTAISVVDKLGAALAFLAERRFGSAVHCDSEGRARVRTKPLDFPAVLEAAFNQIRQAAARDVSVSIRLLEALAAIAEVEPDAQIQEAIASQADAVRTAIRARQADVALDLRAIEDRYANVQALLPAVKPAA